jgi:hypothetical protein
MLVEAVFFRLARMSNSGEGSSRVPFFDRCPLFLSPQTRPEEEKTSLVLCVELYTNADGTTSHKGATSSGILGLSAIWLRHVDRQA